MYKIFKSQIFYILLAIAGALFLAKQLPLPFVRSFITISQLIIDSVLFVLPILIFCYIFSAVNQLERNAPLLITVIFICIFLSNILSLSFGVSMGICFTNWLSLKTVPNLQVDQIFPYFVLPIKNPITSEYMALGAFVIGYFFRATDSSIGKFVTTFQILVFKLQIRLTNFFSLVFIKIIPVYIFGTLLKLAREGELIAIIKAYAPIYCMSIILSIFAVLFYSLVARFVVKIPIRKLMLYFSSAACTGFSTMSSAIAMPVLMQKVEKLVSKKNALPIIIPSVSNMHMAADNILIGITAVGLFSIQQVSLPDMKTWVLFAISFALAKFASVGIAGASLLIILPVLANHLNFSPELLGILTTIYIIQDSIGTSLNVLANGSFAIIINRLLKHLNILPK